MSLPSSMDYTKILPVAAGNPRAMRRTFLPVNGTSFTANGNNIIRIELSASQFWDAKHSYLRFKCTFANGAGNDVGLDNGGLHGFIRRLRVEQAGSVLYDCNRYDKLLAAILLPTQSNMSVIGDRSIAEGQRLGTVGTAGATNTPLAGGATTGAIVANQHNDEAQIDNAGDIILCAPLVGSLFSQDKLVPLQLLSSSPLTIEIELAPPGDIGVTALADMTNYTISDVAYVASLVDVAPEVDNQIRMIQELAGGHIVLNCNDFTHFNGNIPAGAQGQQAINVPARRKSIKSLLFVGASDTFAGGGGARRARFNQSFGGNFNMSNYQVKVGSIMHPATPILVNCEPANGPDYNGRGEALLELMKCFMPVNNVIGAGALSRLNYALTDCDTGGMATTGLTPRYSPFGIDMEAFQRTAIESGVNTADRSTPITLLINIGGPNVEAINVDAFVSYDALYYIDRSGVISVSH
jgi:hypothetical protein